MKKMIKKVMVSLLVAFSAISMNAQELKYGLSTGVNFSVQSQIGDIYNNEDIRTGLHAGVFGKYQMNEKIYLQSEINYDQKGSKNNNTIQKLDYLTIPLIFGYSMGESWNSPIEFNLYSGPYAGINLNTKSEIDVDRDIERVDISGDINKLEFGVIGGFIVKYPIKDKSVFLDFRFGLGLTPYDKTNYEPKNKYFGINLGLEF